MNAMAQNLYWKRSLTDYVRLHHEAGHFRVTIVCGSHEIDTRVFCTYMEAAALAEHVKQWITPGTMDDTHRGREQPLVVDGAALAELHVKRTSSFLRGVAASLQELSDPDFFAEFQTLQRIERRAEDGVIALYETYELREQQCPTVLNSDTANLHEGVGIAAMHEQQWHDLSDSIGAVVTTLSDSNYGAAQATLAGVDIGKRNPARSSVEWTICVASEYWHPGAKGRVRTQRRDLNGA